MPRAPIRRPALHPLFAAWLRQHWVPDITSRVLRRYEITLLSEKEDRYGTEADFLIEGRGGRRAPYVEWYDVTSRDDEWATRERAETIKVYDDVPVGRGPYQIPHSRTLAYRGMSWEEWQAARRQGFVKSAGHYNFGSQADHTCFGADPGQAEHYACGFAPWQFQPGPGVPGIVIAVPRAHVQWAAGQSPAGRPRGPAHPQHGEMFCTHRVPLRDVREVWAAVCTKVKPGKMHLYTEHYDTACRKARGLPPKVSDSGSGPSVDHIVTRLA